MVVRVLAISTNDILSTYPLPHSGELSAYFDEHNVNDSFDNDSSGDLGTSAPAEKSELLKGHMMRGWINQMHSLILYNNFKIISTVPLCFTGGEGSSLEASQADTNMSVTKPSEQPRQDSTISRSLQDASAAPAFKSKTDPEEDNLLEGIPFVCMWVCVCFFSLSKTLSVTLLSSSDEEDLCPPMARPTGVKLTAQQEERLRKADERAVKAQAEIEERKQKWAQL